MGEKTKPLLLTIPFTKANSYRQNVLLISFFRSNKMYDITASIVLHQNAAQQVQKAVDSILDTQLNIRLYLIDNSPNDCLSCLNNDDRIEYIFNPSNPGFGAGHNIAIRKAAKTSKFHAIINPDISFENGVLEQILNYLQQYPAVGILMPKVLYPNGEIQYIAKLLPGPADFIVRRLIPVKSIKKRIDDRFELRKSGYNRLFNVPFLSGCFMVCRTDVLLRIGAFDENIFMYTEDIDICRRTINSGYRCIFYPQAVVYHNHRKKSFTNLNTLKVYLKSAIYYFDKWGWFSDERRHAINNQTLKQLRRIVQPA